MSPVKRQQKSAPCLHFLYLRHCSTASVTVGNHPFSFVPYARACLSPSTYLRCPILMGCRSNMTTPWFLLACLITRFRVSPIWWLWKPYESIILSSDHLLRGMQVKFDMWLFTETLKKLLPSLCFGSNPIPASQRKPCFSMSQGVCSV